MDIIMWSTCAICGTLSYIHRYVFCADDWLLAEALLLYPFPIPHSLGLALSLNFSHSVPLLLSHLIPTALLTLILHSSPDQQQPIQHSLSPLHLFSSRLGHFPTIGAKGHTPLS
jgi:hypothetical protein